MKILSVNIDNFKNLEHVEQDLNGRSIYILGPNGAGKSSFIQAIYSTLTGADLPEVPISTGKEKAGIDVVIGDADKKYKVNLKFTSKNQKGTLTVSNLDGAVFQQPRTFLDKLIGNITFDPFEFIHLGPKQQVEYLKEILGIDFTDLDKKYSEIYAERTIMNRLTKEQEVFVTRENITEEDVATFTHEIDLTKIKQAILDAKEYNQVIEDKAKEGLSIQQTSNNHKSTFNAWMIERNNQIEGLKKQIEEIEQLKLKKENDYNTAQQELSNKLIEIDAYVKGKDLIEITDLQDQYDKAITHNQNVGKVMRYHQELIKLNNFQNDSQELTVKLADITKEKQSILASKKMPFEGLEFTGDLIMYHGLPLSSESINTAKIIEIGMGIGMALNPNLRVLRIKDGSLLDKKTMKDLVDIAATKDYQLFVEKVSDDEKNLTLKFIEEIPA